MTQKIKSEIIVKSTASLDAEVEKELTKEDPSEGKATAILAENEITNE